MKCIRLLFHFFLFRSLSAASYEDSDLLQIFRNVRDLGPISDSCQDALQMYIENIKELNNGLWALQMFDASTKIPVGLLAYNFGELGQFSECLRAESADGTIKARYCLGGVSADIIPSSAEVNFTKQAHLVRKVSKRLINLRDNQEDDTSSADTGFTWALCLPRNCSNEDVREIFHSVLGSKSVTCQTKDDLSLPLTTGALATIVVLAYFAIVLVSSTALDLYYRHTNTKPHHVMLTAFSVYSNCQKLFSVNKNSNELTCLNGIRLFSMVWVLVGHVYSVQTALPTVNYKDIIEWLDTKRSMFLYSGTFSVDTFFLLSGLLIVYSYMKAKHAGVKFNIFQFYIHRYLRLTPALAAAVLVAANLLKYMGSGPKWDAIHNEEQGCRTYWWAALLYVQNYVDRNDYFCLGQSWYLSVDMQLYIISPLLLIPLWKYPKIGTALVSAGILAFIVIPFTISYVYELPSFITSLDVAPEAIDRYVLYYYIGTHTRAAPWFIGVLVGYILAQMKFQGKYKRPAVSNKIINLLVVLLWAVALAVGLACIFGGHNTLRIHDHDVLVNSVYTALVRPAWALSVSWVILACASGYGGPINWLLSLPIYQVLNRFTYSMYLVHYQILLLVSYRMKTGLYFDEVAMSYSFWGLTMFTFGVSVIWVLAFESPITVIEKLIFKSPRKKNNRDENENKRSLPA